MNTLGFPLTALLVVLIMSYGFGLIVGGPDRAGKIVTWELKQLFRFGRWILKWIFQGLANLFRSLAKACGPKMKRRTP